MSKRKILTLAMALCMVAILAVGGTLAYFTDEDAKTNTFTIGNVDIHIDEWMEDGADEDDEWDEYTDKQTLAPLDPNKADLPLNKMVETVNDGSEAAYIRTFVTCPTDMYDYLGLGFNSGNNSAPIEVKDEKGNVIKTIYNVTWKDIGKFMINGEETSVFLCEVVDHQPIASGDSVLSLTCVWLYPNVTNELVEAFDLDEGAFKVKVGSQAIQAANLTYDQAMEALGDYLKAVQQLFDANATEVK